MATPSVGLTCLQLDLSRFNMKSDPWAEFELFFWTTSLSLLHVLEKITSSELDLNL